MFSKRFYKVAEKPSFEIESALANYEPIVRKLLYNRGLHTVEEAEAFLSPNYDTQLRDPFLLPGMEVAVNRILKAIDEREKIVIYSDYDCDGIPGAVILHDFFSAIGHSDFSNYIPHRHYDGFGLKTKSLKKMASYEPKLIITIDCGTTDYEAVSVANEMGIDVIITDHHEPKKVIPEAVAVVNPNVPPGYPFAGLCGAGVVFKLVQALISRGEFNISPGREKWWLDMVGIATIADMVPLIDENRVLAHFGLTVLRKSRRPGLQNLLRRQRVKQSNLNEEDIGFTIGPRINAASRMDTPEDAFRLLATTDVAEAVTIVDHLERLNNERKGLVASMSKEANVRLNKFTELPAVLVFGDPQWRPSLVGLVAGSLAEKHDRPTFLWGRDGNGVLKGSCRSNGKISVLKLMEGASDSLEEYGGHHFSGGFSVYESSVHNLFDRLQNVYDTLGDVVKVEQVPLVEEELSLGDIDENFVQSQKRIGPFGVGNQKPLYAFNDVRPKAITFFGKSKDHIKITFDTKGVAKEAIAFFKDISQFSHIPEVGEVCTLLAYVEESFFMNHRQVRLRLFDIV